jgi:hypothetical protein
VSCIPVDPAWLESPQQLQLKYERLQSQLRVQAAQTPPAD